MYKHTILIALLYTSNEHVDTKNAIPFITAQKYPKYLGVSLTKHDVHELYEENYAVLIK